MKKSRDKSILFLMIVAVNIAASESESSMLQKIYTKAAEQLSYAKKAAVDLWSSDKKEERLPKTMTLAQASLLLQQSIDKQPKDDAAADGYWKAKSSVVVKCAKFLPGETEKQILKTLQEIDKRLIYWLYQRDHQWQYFFSKNPLKWVMGKSQDVEIETNIEQLQNKQDELYTRLGELSAIDWNEYLVALNNYQAAYAWIEKLLNILSGVKEDPVVVVNSNNYGAIVKKLSEELKKVSTHESYVLSFIADTAIPHHIARNWVKYGALMVGAHYAYNSPKVADFVGSLPAMGADLAATFEDNITFVKKYINETFLGRRGGDRLVDKLGKGFIVHEASEQEVGIALENFLDKASAEGWVWSGPLGIDEKKNILAAFKDHNPGPYQKFFNQLLTSPFANKFYLIEAVSLFVQVLHVCTGVSAEEGILILIDQVEGLRNLMLLAPTALGVGLGAFGLHKVYGRLTTYDYSSIRRSLVDISSLFVDQTKPLDDLEYGKMIYLLYNLKEKAQRELPIKGNVRNDFIKDLERVESREFDSAAKRRIIKDMFKKYSFLGFVQ